MLTSASKVEEHSALRGCQIFLTKNSRLFCWKYGNSGCVRKIYAAYFHVSPCCFFSFGTQSREGKKTTWMILKNYRLLLQIHKFSGSTPAEFAYTVERLESQFGGLNRGTNIY